MPSATTRLHDAASQGDLQWMSQLLRGGRADVNANRYGGITALHKASENGHAEAVAVLLAHGANVNATADDERTPLHVASRSGHSDVVKLLVNNSAFLRAKDNTGSTALHLAADTGHAGALTVLLAATNGADVNAKENHGWAPLHLSAWNGHTDAVKVLLAVFGIDVNAKDLDGCTALHSASEKGHADALQALLRANGVDVYAQTKTGSGPLHLAAYNGHTDAVKVLLAAGVNVNAKNTDGYTALHSAAENGHADALKVLLAANDRDVSANRNKRSVALRSTAARHSRADALKVLVANDVAVNAQTRYCWTALHLAASNGHTAAVKVLLSANGVDINAKSNDSLALHIAAGNGHAGALEALLAAQSADVNAKTDGWVALHLAAHRGHADALKVLLAAKGVDVNAQNNECTALHIAADNGRTDAVKVLLTAEGIDVDAICRGETAAGMASAAGNLEALKVLVASGADVRATNSSGETVADVATGDCVAYLAEVAKQTLPSLRKQVYATESQLGDSKLKLEEATRNLEETKRIVRQMEASKEVSLTALLDEVGAVMDGADGWASPVVDPVAEAQLAIEEFVKAREALSTSLAKAATNAVDPGAIAQHRADCCATATVLLERLPLSEDGDTVGIPAAAPRPPPAFVDELTEALSAAKTARTAALATVEHAVSACHGRGTFAEVIQAAMAADAACAPHVEVVEEKLNAARAAIATPAPALSAEECRPQRAVAKTVLEEEGPWAGAVGLDRRGAALTGGRELVARRATAQRAFSRKEKLLALAKAALAVHSDDDDDDDENEDDGGNVEVARAAMHKAEAERTAALPALLAATAAVQEWATSGEGALVLKAFPSDVELTAALAGLFEAEFTAHTALPQTPGVRLDVEYPAGLVESPAAFVFYAERVTEDRTVPVVLRRLRLSSPELVEEARRQVRDAGRIAVGLPSCHDAAAGCPPVVKATRWFLAAGPGGGTADAWLEFPRAELGSLAQALALAQAVASGRVFSAMTASGLCMRLVRAVAQMHAAGIRHGDLNPSNVVLWDDLASDVVRPGIIDLLDTAVVGTTRTLRGATLEWLAPEATEAVAAGTKAYGTRELDCWQLGRVCEAVLGAAAALPDQLMPMRAAAAALCVADPSARTTAATALLAMEAAVAGASAAAMATSASLQWALPPAQWLCQRGEAPGVDFVALGVTTDAAATALTACAASVGRRVRAVYRLENLRLWHVYAAERARVAEEAQGAVWPERLVSEAAQTFDIGRGAIVEESVDAPGEALLLHGAPKQSHRLIAEGGLDPSYSGGRVGAMFGAATCLTPSWAKAANEYARGAGAGVFVTRAAVGCVADCLATPRTETREYRRPPDGHHSVLGDNGSPGAVVAVYRSSQMYPEYLVVFDD